MCRHEFFDMFNHYCMIFLFRLSSLTEPYEDRKQQLEDSLKLQQFYRDTEDEMHWIKEHRPLAVSDDVGKSLQEAQNLTKKHQVCSFTRISLISNFELEF